MAAFNFPNSPSTNDLHTENGVTYKWNGTVWKRQNASYTDATNLNVTGIATFANNVSIGGTLTYEDVKNVDSVGIITSRSYIKVNSTQDQQLTLNSTDDGPVYMAFQRSGTRKSYFGFGGSSDRLYLANEISDGDIYITGNDGGSTINCLTFDVSAGGNATFSGEITIPTWLVHAGDSNTKFGFEGPDTITFETAGSERLRIDSAGKIGINNTAPLYEMHFQNAMGSSPSWIHMEVTGSNTVGGGGGIAFDTSASNNATNNSLYLATVKGIRNSANDGSNDLVFSTSRNGVNGDDGNQNTPLEKLRINSHGRVLIGHSSARISSSTVNPIFQLEGIDHHSALGVIRNSSSAYGSYLVLGKSRSSSVGGYTILQDNDAIGSIRFAGADGVDMAQYGAEIAVIVDGTPGADSMPGEMIFRTNTGSGNPTEKLRITKQGIVSINDSTPESFATLQIKNHTTVSSSQILLHGADMAQIIMRDDTGGTNTKCTTIRNDQGALIFGTHNDSYSGFSGKLRIKSDGDIRAGDDANTWAGDRLEIAGTKEGVLGLANYGSTASEGGIINFYRSISGTVGSDTVPTDNIGGLTFRGWSGNAYQICATIGASTDGTWNSSGDNTDVPGKLTFSTTPDGDSACAERLRITSAGLVGIGITNPNSTLHLATDASPAQGTDFATLSLGSPTQALRKVEVGARRSTRGGDWDNVGIGFKVHESNNHLDAPETKMVLDYDGNLGIGTVDPTYKLHVQEDTSTVARFERTGGAWAKVDIKAGNNTGNSYLTFSDTDASERGEINYEHSDDSLRFGTAGTANRMKIDSDGYVTKPNNPWFHVQGSPSISNTPHDNGLKQFANVHSNNGSHYSNSTGVFTVPVAGFYFFSAGVWSSNSDANNGSTYALLYKKDSSGGSAVQFAGANHHDQWGQLTMAAGFYCAVGDQIYVFYNGSIQASTPRNYFSGCLLA